MLARARLASKKQHSLLFVRSPRVGGAQDARYESVNPCDRTAEHVYSSQPSGMCLGVCLQDSASDGLLELSSRRYCHAGVTQSFVTRSRWSICAASPSPRYIRHFRVTSRRRRPAHRRRRCFNITSSDYMRIKEGSITR